MIPTEEYEKLTRPKKATALEHNLTLVTRNTRDFPATKVPVYNPWT